MVEAIGLAASIAGLVRLTGSVFKQVTKFCKEAKDAPSKAQDFCTQTRDLTGIIKNLRLLTSFSSIPGSGKTVLCGLVIETVLEQSDHLTAVCFAFCDYKNPDSCLPENILAVLAVQLGLQGEEAFDLLGEDFDMLHPDDKLPTKPRLDDLMKLVGCVSQAYEKVFVIVDGLDECGDQVARMTRSLEAIVNESEIVSSALFSRKEQEIREQLAEGFEHIEVSAHVNDLEEYTIAADAALSGEQAELSTVHQLPKVPLHVAVFLLSPKLYQFLIDSGVDVKVVRGNFTQLAMIIALKGEGSLDEKMKNPRLME
ncbi:hypothetical protein FMEXI_2739 [Fusarium mexicanum]|uniref:Nephrocystin 3-like N-terminal domain-containing protein n=1 Tax=Fusarium mexicanum TaxID=751941 RepID=A0A8H5JE80_9HYPO|nr:hypothetical protein FMEXI_2739 [Fusarium mexicanum]